MNKNNLRYLGFNDFWLIIVGIPTIGFFMPIFFFGASLENGLIAYLSEWLQGTMYTTVYWLGTRYILIQLRKRIPHFKNSMKRIVLQVLLVIAYSSIASPLATIISRPLFTYLGNPDHKTITGTVGTYGVIFLMIAIYEAVYFYSQLKRSIEEKEQAKQAQLKSELQGLRNQVNPHFLFNSLNTLMNIVSEDQNLAISFVKKLSKVYRYVLESRGEQLIPLSDEMNFMEAYIFLQKERFQKNLNIDIKIDSVYLDFNIIPLAMQILFENAIKHNIISSKKPLHIKVYIENKKIVVENNLQLKRTVANSTQVGLNNVQTRYKIFTEKEVEVIQTANYFIVKLPLLK